MLSSGHLFQYLPADLDRQIIRADKNQCGRSPIQNHLAPFFVNRSIVKTLYDIFPVFFFLRGDAVADVPRIFLRFPLDFHAGVENDVLLPITIRGKGYPPFLFSV